MLFSRSFTLAFAASAFASLPGFGSSDGFVKMEFDILKDLGLSTSLNDFITSLLPENLSARDNSGSAPLINERTFYVSKLSIGNPASEVEVLLDTGSSDLWVMSSRNPQCKDNGGSIDCEQYGTYNETASTTFKNNHTNFYIQYLATPYANGTWGTDKIALTDSLKLKDASFAVAEDSDSNVGVFGIGFIELESGLEKYINVPALMKQQGLINKVAYSLYLGSMESNKGNILFGGVDHAKYSGDLKEIDISLQDGKYPYLQIPLTQISVQKESSSSKAFDAKDSKFSSLFNKRSGDNQSINTNSAPALLDSGTTLSLLPDDIMKLVVEAIDHEAAYNTAAGGYIVNCTLALPLNSVTFTFDGEKDIVVPMTDLIISLGNSGTGGQQCMLGLVPGSMLILGDNFLRSAYSVFNLDDKTISIAQVKYSDDQDIQVIS